MKFFSLYDLIQARAYELGVSDADIIKKLHKHNVKKSDLTDMQYNSYIPDDENLLAAIGDICKMSILEIYLHMGRIPDNYQKSFEKNIPAIAAMLTPEKDQVISSDLIPYYTTTHGALYKSDCSEFLQTVSDNSIDLIFADPPFNLKKEYDVGINDNKSMTSYLGWMESWLKECVRVLKPGGRLFVYNLPKWSTYAATYLNQSMVLWDWIAVDMKCNLPIPGRLYPAHYALIGFMKGAKGNTFSNQRIPMQVCRHCGGEIKDYGGWKNKMNPHGVNVSDVWSDIYPVRHKRYKKRKFNELSVKLLHRVISMASDPEDLVLDPFGGSGTTFVVAELLNRRWIGCEIGDCDVIVDRLNQPSSDIAQLLEIEAAGQCLFSKKTLELRKKNGFWTDPKNIQ